jgi:predicted TIM-barrel fold metal-dependent hydrolase
MQVISRRRFLEQAAAVSALGTQALASPMWGGPVLDIHLHLRRDPEQNLAHMDGCGVDRAIVMARESSADEVRGLQRRHSGRLQWSASTDVTNPAAATLLRQAVAGGAIGLGELKAHVEADGPEMRRLYEIAGDLKVPILVHFQEVPHFEGEGVFGTGFKRLGAMLKAYPKTTFVGHADAFWANVSADYADETAYPTGPVKPGGVTDRLLTEYPNLFGDLSANSGNNALSRDPAFTRDFLARHQDKLVFGSDCGCADGRGSGTGQPNNPAAARLAGKCVARETLTLLKNATTPGVFRKLTWDNGHRLYGIAKAPDQGV